MIDIFESKDWVTHANKHCSDIKSTQQWLDDYRQVMHKIRHTGSTQKEAYDKIYSSPTYQNLKNLTRAIQCAMAPVYLCWLINICTDFFRPSPISPVGAIIFVLLFCSPGLLQWVVRLKTLDTRTKEEKRYCKRWLKICDKLADAACVATLFLWYYSKVQEYNELKIKYDILLKEKGNDETGNH